MPARREAERPPQQIRTEPTARDAFPAPTPHPPSFLPRPTRPRELPRPAPPSRALELPRTSEPARPETERTEPGTWREIIARFERELGPAPIDEPLDAALPVPGEASTGTEATIEDAAPSATEATIEDAAPLQAELPVEAAAPIEAQSTDREPPVEQAVTPAEPHGPSPEADTRDQPEPFAPPPESDDSGPLETMLPWEFEAMTTPDYRPPHSIHDPEHDSWPVDAADGDTVPAWSDDSDTTAGDVPAQPGFGMGEMLLDEVVEPDPWDMDPDDDGSADDAGSFPLDAFIVPVGVEHAPAGYDENDVAHRVAHRLDEIARGLRDAGLGALGDAGSTDELSRVLAAIVTGYVTRDG